MSNPYRGEVELTINDKTVNCYLSVRDLVEVDKLDINIFNFFQAIDNTDTRIGRWLDQAISVLCIASHGELKKEDVYDWIDDIGLEAFIPHLSDLFNHMMKGKQVDKDRLSSSGAEPAGK